MAINFQGIRRAQQQNINVATRGVSPRVPTDTDTMKLQSISNIASALNQFATKISDDYSSDLYHEMTGEYDREVLSLIDSETSDVTKYGEWGDSVEKKRLALDKKYKEKAKTLNPKFLKAFNKYTSDQETSIKSQVLSRQRTARKSLAVPQIKKAINDLIMDAQGKHPDDRFLQDKLEQTRQFIQNKSPLIGDASTQLYIDSMLGSLEHAWAKAQIESGNYGPFVPDLFAEEEGITGYQFKYTEKGPTLQGQAKRQYAANIKQLKKERKEELTAIDAATDDAISQIGNNLRNIKDIMISEELNTPENVQNLQNNINHNFVRLNNVAAKLDPQSKDYKEDLLKIQKTAEKLKAAQVGVWTSGTFLDAQESIKESMQNPSIIPDVMAEKRVKGLFNFFDKEINNTSRSLEYQAEMVKIRNSLKGQVSKFQKIIDTNLNLKDALNSQRPTANQQKIIKKEILDKRIVVNSEDYRKMLEDMGININSPVSSILSNTSKEDGSPSDHFYRFTIPMAQNLGYVPPGITSNLTNLALNVNISEPEEAAALPNYLRQLIHVNRAVGNTLYVQGEGNTKINEMINVYNQYANMEVYRTQPQKLGKLIYMRVFPDSEIAFAEKQLLKNDAILKISQLTGDDYLGDPADQNKIKDDIIKRFKASKGTGTLAGRIFKSITDDVSVVKPEDVKIRPEQVEVILNETIRRVINKIESDPELFKSYKLNEREGAYQNSSLFLNTVNEVINITDYDYKTGSVEINSIYSKKHGMPLEHITNNAALSLKDKIDPEIYKDIVVTKNVSNKFIGKDPLARLHPSASNLEMLAVIGVQPNSDGQTVSYLDLDKVQFVPDGFEFIDVTRNMLGDTFDNYHSRRALSINNKDKGQNYRIWSQVTNTKKERVPRWKLYYKNEPLETKNGQVARWYSDVPPNDIRDKRVRLNTMQKKKLFPFLDNVIPDNILQDILFGSLSNSTRVEAIKQTGDVVQKLPEDLEKLLEKLTVKPGESKILGMK
tara:strand:+ start:12968 stop:15964 length:2997 start_codon:yes stop_codon:yes gene_type:complete